ncbi:hypothetical protein [Bacillus ndiopicus]|uniref:hypothetical protein n=1 Tax=Bacillus ndiopicus TaxID=1347368 RepID=UPI000694756E|nr:hypothetical protein [Bacillus ndiopicus]
MKVLSTTSLIASIIFFIMGFYRLVFYSNPGFASSESRHLESTGHVSFNAWVGGDAFNYIINAAQATAYFVLFGVFYITFVLIKIGVKLQNTADSSFNSYSNRNVNFDDKENNFEDMNKW